jgi:HAMP domain-containing protein
MKWLLHNGIQGRLVTLLGFSIGVTAIMAVVIWRVGIAPALQLALMEKQQEIARRASEQIDNFLEQRISELKAAIRFGFLLRGSIKQQKADLSKLLEASPKILSLRLIDAHGHPVVKVFRDGHQSEPALDSYRSTLVFTEGRQGRVHVSEALYSSSGEPFVTIGIPLAQSEADVEAILAAEVSLKTLWSSISKIKVGKAGQLYIVSPGGGLIAHPDSNKVALNLNLAHLDAVSRFIARRATGSEKIHLGENGKSSLSSYSVVARSGWGVVAEEDADTALGPIRRVEWLAGALLLFTILGSFVISQRFSLRVTEPIRLLEKQTQLISQGQLNQKVVFHSGDEVQSLAESFNRMADALKSSYEDLEAKITERTKDIAVYTPRWPRSSRAALSTRFLQP